MQGKEQKNMVNEDLQTLDIKNLQEKSQNKGESGRRARNILRILEKYDYRCVLCGSRDKDNFTIHHVEKYNDSNQHKKDSASKYNMKKYNCVCLCLKCHLLVHGKIEEKDKCLFVRRKT